MANDYWNLQKKTEQCLRHMPWVTKKKKEKRNEDTERTNEIEVFYFIHLKNFSPEV